MFLFYFYFNGSSSPLSHTQITTHDGHEKKMQKQKQVPRNTQYNATTYSESANYINSGAEDDFEPFSVVVWQRVLILLCVGWISNKKANLSQFLLCLALEWFLYGNLK